MKKQIKSLLLVVLLIGYALPLWAQASTEGKEFWVALNITTGTGGTDHKPFIYITTQHQGGRYTITNPADATMAPITGLIPATGYVKITIPGDNTGTANLDLNRWYPVGLTAPAASNQIKNVGLKIETTVDCSVYAANSLPQSFDAANILPVTALQMDYITQDYPGYDHGGTGTGDGGFPEITILATENNTQVKINPSSAVLNSNGTALITKTLNAGQVLYITGENRATLSGSVITSDKKIAVFTGVNNTDVPGPKSARDHLYEQNMPIDYWGTHFVVTRSMKKDANRIRVTAKENGTSIFVDGYEIATINSGETYEFELCSPEMRTQSPYTSAVGEGRGTQFYFDGPAHYLETSCPCAVFSYDVSETYYISSGTSERDPNAHGDPSMVWISPLEQQLSKITFGVMNTANTTAHYVNVITPTEGASSLEVREVAMNAGQVVYGNNMVNPADVQPVPGNPTYSYARIKLVEDAEKIYTITSDIGFIAHVYGSGDKESYAYSCGSAAVQQGVKVNGTTFINGYRSEDKFCISDTLQFDAKVGTDIITRVDWDFGDGTTEFYGNVQTSHNYTSTGWFDVTADLYGHQVCTTEDEVELGSISFSFYIARADTLYVNPGHDCLSLEDQESMTAEQIAELLSSMHNDTVNKDTREHCYDPVFIQPTVYGLDTYHEFEERAARDSVKIGDNWYYAQPGVQDIPDTIPNSWGCDSIMLYHMRITTTLDFALNEQSAETCEKEDVSMPYTYRKGEIGEIWMTDKANPDKIYEVENYPTETGTGDIILPTSQLKAGKYNMALYLVDAVFGDTVVCPFTLLVLYPADIFKIKFGNVLAVYNSKNNGGYNFTGFQWFMNGDTIPGATQSVYHSDTLFVVGDEFYVELTDPSGMKLQSCPQTVTSAASINEKKTMPAEKIMQDRHLYIRKDDVLYDIYGQRVR